MDQAAANGAPVAHGTIGDRAGDCGQGAIGGIWHPAVLDVRVGDAGADQKTIVLGLDAQQIGHRCDVDQEVRLCQAEIEHRSERLAAGQKLHRKVLALQKCDRIGQSRRPRIIESCGLHAASLALWIASKMRRGVMGEAQTSAPSGRSASLIALAIAAGGPMAPPSPRPLTPNSV